ncbi:glycerol-3-phosphate cytidylyltransferase [Endozoicomonas sp. (ex Bugula neritina AB1)]|nr:glycerol-3-phosphate cytidylyltransferase [Endozoicomonas sp. (ex Bugula neritina AB1)]
MSVDSTRGGTIITYGTFDLFHVGHVRILKNLRALGEKLLVGISSDEFNALKGKKSFFSYEERAEIVQSCVYVDMVFPEHSWEQKVLDMQKYKVDIFGIGADWAGKFDELKAYVDVVYIDRTSGVSSTEIKSRLSNVSLGEICGLEESIRETLSTVSALRVALER